MQSAAWQIGWRKRRRRSRLCAPERRTTALFASLHLHERRCTTGFRTSSARPAHDGAKIGREPIDQISRAYKQGPEISQKGHVMFRKVAIALVAASVLTAPVLAQGVAPSAGKVSQPTPVPAPTAKTVKADTAATKHHMVARHHRHGTK